MARIHPFCGLTYSPDLAGKLDQLVTQPYDKIDRPLQEKYYARDPHNVIRVIKSDETVANPESTYPGAAATLAKWIAEGKLVESDKPAFYLYYQTFKFLDKTYVRKGFMASVALEEERVKSHEHTLAGPKADRLRLLHALETNDECIFMLYTDPSHDTVALMDSVAASHKPALECRDDYGEVHQVWIADSPDFVAKMQKLLEPCDLYIADGHHRYETACNFKRECLNKGWKTVDKQSFDHRMMALFPMEDPGLVVLPTHRLIRNVENFSAPKLLAALGENFKITPLSSAVALFAQLDTYGTDQVMGMKALGTSDEFYLLQPKDNRPLVVPEKLSPLSESARKLGVTILHTLILEKELGIDAAVLSAGTHVDYVRSRQEAIDAVGKDGIQAVFLLNPTSVNDVKTIAAAGERMPQKSTDFYPKLLAGLVMMKLHIQKPA
ncbi:MAG: DUF1015 domain-containing protein [Calditrichaeota bacterium]|nr:DUF1015 domain-containing protein [Calditrichota bacterium]